MGTSSAAIVQGHREEQEDRYCIHSLQTKGLNGWLLGVFDGHGDDVAAAEYCRRNLFDRFKPKNALDVSYALGRAVRRLAQETEMFTCGTTLSAVCIIEDSDRAIVATIGDSPVIVVSTDQNVWTSSAHNVGTNENERKAAEQRGAVYRNGYIALRPDGPWLQLSRSLGDKNMRAILSRNPDMKTIRGLTRIVLATDGILNETYADDETCQQIAALTLLEDANANAVLAWRASIDKLHDNTTVLMWRK